MPATLTVRDHAMTPGGQDHVFELEFPTESITVRELIRERIYQEVQDYNHALDVTSSGPFRGLVQPSKSEAELNGDRSRRVREIDWKKQYELATEAYENRRILVLVGDLQTESLDERIQIVRGTEVTFLRLVLLVGG